MRDEILSGGSPDLRVETIKHAVLEAVAVDSASTLVPVFNLTGIILHSNLGRANLSRSAIEAVNAVADSASNLEFDLKSGKRGQRESHIESLICGLTNSEAATVVNNNAAAVLLVLNTLALGRGVSVSRGELVEIGGSFRIPDIMARAGCELVEVGTTNRTHLADFERSISDNTALLMKVYTSNYKIEGFTSSVPEVELSNLAKENQLPFVIDLGCGNLVNLKIPGLEDEPTVISALKSGADLVTFSGDKLLGGPQAGLILGRKDLITLINANPLKRALRLDKMSLAALSETLKLYRDPTTLHAELPIMRIISRSASEIRSQAEKLLPAFINALGNKYHICIADTVSQIGSGSLPIKTLPTSAIRIEPSSGEDYDLRKLMEGLKGLSKPIIGRIHKSALWLDLRCLQPSENNAFSIQLNELKL